MPLPLEPDACSCPESTVNHTNDQFSNYDLPKLNNDSSLPHQVRYVVSYLHLKFMRPMWSSNLSSPMLQNANDADVCGQYYDTPRNVKPPVNENPGFGNYDVPPAAVPLKSSCVCTSKMK